MLRFLIVTASFCLVRGNPLSTNKNLTWITCDDANVEADRSLAESNAEIKRKGEDNMMVDHDGFQSAVDLHVFGWKLPAVVSLEVSQGNLTGMDTLVRAADAKDCATYTAAALEGIFEYGPEFSLRYEVATAKFLGWEIHGKFVFKPKPRLHVFLLNDTISIIPSCRMESISLENPGQSEYVFEYGNSWMGWLVSKLLARGLEYKDDTPMMTHVGLWSQAEVGSYLVAAWCQPDKMSHD